MPLSLQVATTRCYGEVLTQQHTWSENGLHVLSTHTLASGTAQMRRVDIDIMCDQNVYGNANFSLSVAEASDDHYALQGAHRCACAGVVAADPAYCSQPGASPEDQGQTFASDCMDTLQCTDACAQGTIHMLVAAATIMFVVFLGDVIVACSKGAPALNRVSWLQCVCCSICNVLSAPELSVHPTAARAEAPRLVVMGSISGSFMLTNGGILLLTTDDLGMTEVQFIAFLAAALVVLTFPVMALVNCAFKDLGALIGLAYCSYGAYINGSVIVCVVVTSNSLFASPVLMWYVPGFFGFVASAFIYLKILFRSCRVRITKTHSSPGDPGLHVKVGAGDAGANAAANWTHGHVIDCRDYVTFLLAKRSVAASQKHPTGLWAKFKATFASDDFDRELIEASSRGTGPHAPTAMVEAEGGRRARTRAQRGGVQLNDSPMSNSPSWVTGGGMRIMLAQTLTFAILAVFVSLWILASISIVLKAEAFASSGKCCNGVSCFTAAGFDPEEASAAENWSQAGTLSDMLNAVFSQDPAGTDAPPVVAFDFAAGADCHLVGIIRRYTLWILIGIAVFNFCICVVYFFLTHRKFAKQVSQIQQGRRGSELPRASEGSEPRTAMLKYVGTQTAFAVGGWIINTVVLLLLVVPIMPVLCLGVYGLLPNFAESLKAFLLQTVWDNGQPGTVSVLVIHSLALFIFTRIFPVNQNRVLYSFAAVFEQFFYTLNGLVDLASRYAKAMFFTLVQLARVDTDIVPGPEWMPDEGYEVYRQLLQLDAYYSNRVMLSFVRIMMETRVEPIAACDSGTRRSGRDDAVSTQPMSTPTWAATHREQVVVSTSASVNWHEGSDASDEEPLLARPSWAHPLPTTPAKRNGPRKSQRSVRACTRWHLAYTLMNNPQLASLRGGRWKTAFILPTVRINLLQSGPPSLRGDQHDDDGDATWFPPHFDYNHSYDTASNVNGNAACSAPLLNDADDDTAGPAERDGTVISVDQVTHASLDNGEAQLDSNVAEPFSHGHQHDDGGDYDDGANAGNGNDGGTVPLSDGDGNTAGVKTSAEMV